MCIYKAKRKKWLSVTFLYTDLQKPNFWIKVFFISNIAPQNVILYYTFVEKIERKHTLIPKYSASLKLLSTYYIHLERLVTTKHQQKYILYPTIWMKNICLYTHENTINSKYQNSRYGTLMTFYIFVPRA